MKKNITYVVAVLDLNNKKLQHLIAQMPCSRQTAQRHISQTSADIAVTMLSDLKSSLAFSIVFDELTDIKDSPQPATFVRYVSSDLTIKEQLLDLVAIRETTLGVDINNAFDEALTRFHVPLNKLVSVASSNPLLH